jgi:dipeptidyl aminopeptidase/acylaminoacyl peptidase
MKKWSFLCFLALILSGQAQEQVTYQTPPEEILKLAEAPLAPRVLITDNGQHMILMYRSPYKTIAELSEVELRLAGLRINPVTNIGSRTNYYENLHLKNPEDRESRQVSGLPQNPRLANFTLAPDQETLAMTHTTTSGVELWIVDLSEGQARKLTGPVLNANLGDAINWFKDSENILVKTLPPDRKALIDRQDVVPSGPTIATNDGKKAQNRTYQDLIKNPDDAFNFEQLARSELKKVGVDGKMTPWMGPALYRNISFSPDGNYVMLVTAEKPFSYLVPYSRFPSKTRILSRDGEPVQTLIEVPLIEDLPKGFMAERTGKRDFSWRRDKPATLVYAEALDGGDPAVEAPFRDQVYLLEAPFDGPGIPLVKTINRYQDILWGTDEVAVASDWWWDTRNTKSYLINPSKPGAEPQILSDRSYQDRYGDPGNFATMRNSLQESVLALDNRGHAFLLGDGYTEEGQFPFVDRLDLKTGEKFRLYESRIPGKMETLLDYNPAEDQLLVQLESPTEYPNYYYKSLIRRKGPAQLTFFENPFRSIQDVHKEVITYKRDDGLELSGTLYLPAGFNRSAPEKKPMILWAYPREFKDKNSAAQNTQNPNEFTYPYWGSPIYWVSRGYVVLDDAAFPIIGEGDAEPNDSFRTQLVANAKAAIDAVDAMGYIDRTRVGVGGHSYGAFMVANLLSHSDLFAAGVARSGAYNRTLTPFGFQSEQRNYWEAPEVYYTMSPFMHAEKMKTPLLLIHGEADNNSGTYPMQSERYFNALKGLGAQVRLVMLPKESHGYRARESILHMLWEQDQWFEKYLKGDTDALSGQR